MSKLASGDKSNHEEEVGFLPDNSAYTWRCGTPDVVNTNLCNKVESTGLLTREDLLRLDKEKPVWRRMRLFLFILFWVLWIGLLVASVIIIVFTPKCPPRPELEFWQSNTGYWLNPFAFADSDHDMIGDFNGILMKLNYLKEQLGVGFVVLDSILDGYFSNEHGKLGLTKHFTRVDPVLGTLEDFQKTLKAFQKHGIKVVVTLDFNAISHEHEWAGVSSYLKESNSTWVSRFGKDAVTTIRGKQFYSVNDPLLVDLDLSSSNVTRKAKEVMKFWLDLGVDGILLTNVGFYVEGKSLTTFDARRNTQNKWFDKYPDTQLISNASVHFVQNLRTIVEEISAISGKKRLLAVDIGDIGYGLTNKPDAALNFLGSVEYPAAHMVISRQFVKNRGWKALINGTQIRSTISGYDVVSSESKHFFGLTTATSTDCRYNDLQSTAATFLLPGTPLIYFGSELGIEPIAGTTPPKELYPNGSVPYPNLNEIDSSLASHLPMPWDESGKGYSAGTNDTGVFQRYLKQFGITETVAAVTAVGRGPTTFSLIKQLIELRKEPSLLWGDFKSVTSDIVPNDPSFEVFVRKAEGFPAYIIVLFRGAAQKGHVLDFSSICDSVVAKVVYPPNPTWSELKEPQPSKNIYLMTSSQALVYVFACSA